MGAGDSQDDLGRPLSIVVLCPVLNRPANARRVSASLQASGADARLLFICSPHDRREIQACRDTGADVLVVDFESGHGDWARKINTGLRHSEEDWLLLGADDLAFQKGWDREALRVAEVSGVGVIGTNDLGNKLVIRGQLATHPLVSRSYAMEQGTIDEKGKILHEGYRHNWVDHELSETARSRLQFAFARRSYVEHLHPLWKKGAMDATYEIALNKQNYERDYQLLGERRKLWMADLRQARVRAKARR